jgi:hypothetical protein
LYERRKLTDILHAADIDAIAADLARTEAAPDMALLPPGEYIATVMGESTVSGKNTVGYKLDFRIIEEEYTGRHVWLDLWYTEAAKKMTRRDLAKLGATTEEQIKQLLHGRPLPVGIRCSVAVVIRTEDDGRKRNRVRTFKVIGIDPPDPFAPVDNDPTDDGGAGGADDKGDAREGPADQLVATPEIAGDGPYGATGGRC